MDKSPIWLEELQVAMDRRYLDRLDRAIDELVRLGWTCQRSRNGIEGRETYVSIFLSKTMETDLCP
jgi:hypothetical protein